jgi:hydrogenase/urease accessory protein HupE
MLRRSALCLIAFCLPQLAFAHSPIEGVAKFYGGLLHPVLVPSHALALLVFALLVGQGGVRAMRFAYPAFLAVLAVGLVLAGMEVPAGLTVESVLLTVTFVCGLLVALQVLLPIILYAILGAGLGLLIGIDSGVTDYTRQETFAALLGTWLGAAIALVAVAGVVELLVHPWQRVAVRVLGSWGTASAVLVLALALR